ncbi:unnamed protein product [Ambrosiozyma monospora]|uniref:Unnamed protein product n=1 Tax=Ambrosiozyma monospora TaxID=43982 RepID=A0A9W6YSG9_AMBMO|nr:unnamed protein product [Ambrosiozyma monospora]
MSSNRRQSIILLSDDDDDSEIQVIRETSVPVSMEGHRHSRTSGQPTPINQTGGVISRRSHHHRSTNGVDEPDIVEVGPVVPITEEIQVTGEREISESQRARYLENARTDFISQQSRENGSTAGFLLNLPGVVMPQLLSRDSAAIMAARNLANVVRAGHVSRERRGIGNVNRTARGRRRGRGAVGRGRGGRLNSGGRFDPTLPGIRTSMGAFFQMISDNAPGGFMNLFMDDGANANWSSGDEIPRNLMDEIARREQASENSRVNSREKIANKMKSQSAKISMVKKDEQEFYSNGISSTDDSVCVLCGVVLAEGIPEDYDPIKDEDKIRDLVLNKKFKSPWQCCKKLTTADRDLSQKIFFGRCGHVYCGRCVNNIHRRKGSKKRVKPSHRDMSKVSLGTVDFDDFEYSAPTKCVGAHCSKAVTGKFFFRQLYI